MTQLIDVEMKLTSGIWGLPIFKVNLVEEQTGSIRIEVVSDADKIQLRKAFDELATIRKEHNH